MTEGSQVGWDRDLNSGSPKFKSSVLPLRQLTRWRSFCFVEYHHVKDFAVDPGGLGRGVDNYSVWGGSAVLVSDFYFVDTKHYIYNYCFDQC